MPAKGGPLAGMRVIESSLLGPGAVTTHLADLGAEVIKVEPPSGDYIREMTWPIVEGVSLLHLHVHRGKRSLVLDLRKPEAVQVYLDLARGADAVVEAMRPGSLARRGLGYEQLRAVNPRIVFCNVSGYGMTGPYRDVTAMCQQVWGGVGFTIEYDIQLYFSRAKQLQLTWWDSRHLEELIAADVLDGARAR